MRILVDGIPLARAAWHIALIVQCPVAIGAPTRLGALPIAPARAADPTTRFALIIVGTAVTLAALGWISCDAAVVAIAIAVTLRQSRVRSKDAKRRDKSDNDNASD